MYQICSKLAIKKLGWRYWPCFGVFIVVNFEHIHTLFWRFHCSLWRSKCQMRGVVLDICDKGQCVKLTYVLQLNWNFGNIGRILIPSNFLGAVLLLSLRSPIYDIHKKWPTNYPSTSAIRKNEQQIYCLNYISYSLNNFLISLCQ